MARNKLFKNVWSDLHQCGDYVDIDGSGRRK
jgi:hypothetical protein